MPQPSWREVVFSIKTFAAAMLALYIAFRLSLTQPSWAMLTVFVVSQPIAGMVVAKSLFRVVGTIVGATVALTLVSLLAQNGTAFLLALALWIGVCTFTAVLLRDAPGAYGAMLSGYTAAIVGIPAALAPGTAFDYASGRCIEILLGIGCATLISQLVFPQTAGVALKNSVDTTLGALTQWIGDVLRGENQSDKILTDQKRMIADVIALDSLRTFSTYDTPSVLEAGDVARHLQGQFLNMLALLVSIHDRMGMLQNHVPAKYEDLRPLLDQVAEVLDPESSQDRGNVDLSIEHLKARIDARLPDFDELVRDHENILVRTILLRLRDVLTTWRRIEILRGHLFAGRPVRLDDPAPATARYRDVTLAVVAGLISTSAVTVTSAFWLATGWPQGSSAVIFSGVICSILASLDDPATAAANFLKMTFYSAVLAAIYAFGILPHVTGFESLVMTLLPFYIPFGILLAMPRIGIQVTPLGLNLAALLGLTNTEAAPDFASFLNSTLALLVGIAAGITMFRLLRPLGTDWTIRRIRRGLLRDLQFLAHADFEDHRNLFSSRMFDRINALFTRVDVDDPAQRDLIRGSLSGLRIGLNIFTLKRVTKEMPPEPGRAIDAALAVLSRHFRHLKNGKPTNPSLPEIDKAASILLKYPSAAAEDGLTSLIAIRSTLIRHAEFFGMEQTALLPGFLTKEASA